MLAAAAARPTPQEAESQQANKLYRAPLSGAIASKKRAKQTETRKRRGRKSQEADEANRNPREAGKKARRRRAKQQIQTDQV